MRNIIALILGGGRGTRLFPLTKFRSKPAVPFAGKYRLIDIPISNCLNSNINQIYVLTQFLSASLHRHITHTYKLDSFNEGFVEILAAQQTNEGSDWYQGTADAVRQNLPYVKGRNYDQVLILSGDQLYSMDFRQMLQTHLTSEAAVTIGVLPVPREQASGFGVIRLDESGRVIDFAEKPTEADVLERFRTPAEWLDKHGLESNNREFLASMGIYLFRRDLLVDLLTGSAHTDFGREIFPESIARHHVQAHLFDGYWEDVGTISSFMRANMELTKQPPPFALATQESRIFTRPRFLPPSQFGGASIEDSLIADGCTVQAGSKIENSVIGLRCHVGRNATIRDSVVMGADYYETDEELKGNRSKGIPDIGIGDDCLIEGAIVDKNCRIGNRVRVSEGEGSSPERYGVEIHDGFIVVPKAATLPDGWRL